MITEDDKTTFINPVSALPETLSVALPHSRSVSYVSFQSFVSPFIS